MKNKTAVVFDWDWKENAPIGEIVNAIQNIPNSKLWGFADEDDTATCIVAISKKDAFEAYKQYYIKNYCDGDFEDAELDNCVVPWKDDVY